MTDAKTHGPDESVPLSGDGMPDEANIGLRDTLRQ